MMAEREYVCVHVAILQVLLIIVVDRAWSMKDPLEFVVPFETCFKTWIFQSIMHSVSFPSILRPCSSLTS